MASSIFSPTHLDFSLFPFHCRPLLRLELISIAPRRTTARCRSSSYTAHHRHFHCFKLGRGFSCAIPANASAGDGGFPFEVSFEGSSVPEEEPVKSSSSSSIADDADTGDGYLPLFVRMLGLDNDPLDREQAVVAIWKYALGGKQKIDKIMQFSGCINLIINLLNSQSSSACEAASGLLRELSSISSYRDIVAESGAVEELSALVTQSKSSLTPEVKEQSLCALWNLSADEKLRVKMAKSDLLPSLIKLLDDDIEQVKEAAGGVLANLALTRTNHDILVEAGVIPKLAKFLTREVEGSKIMRREAKSTLLELAEDEYYRINIMEEGLLLVPLVGAAAFESFRPSLYSWPSLPDGTEIKRAPKVPSKYGASDLLVGLSKEGNNVDLNELKVNAIIGRTQQQFLARLQAIENENENPASGFSSRTHHTLLPWKDGIARLVLILELKDDVAIARAADSIADAAINEKMRVMFKEAGGIKHLVHLLDHESDAVRTAVTNALEKLSLSNTVCWVIEDEGILSSLVRTLKDSTSPENVTEKMLTILARILDPSKEMKSKFFTAPVNGSKDVARSMEDHYQSNPTAWKNELDSTLISRLVEILKSSHPRLQTKAASILEFMTMVHLLENRILATDIGSGLAAAFEQKVLNAIDSDEATLQPELLAADLEEAGLAVSAASRLLTKLLDSDSFRSTINTAQLKNSLRRLLKSDIPLQYKEWVAASLIKLSPPHLPLENPITAEITLYETIPRLIDQIKNAPSQETQETAVLELNQIVSEGVVDATSVVAAQDGIPPLVKLVESGTDKAVEASLAILYNLSMDRENHVAILAAGTVHSLRRVVALQRPHWQRALRLLRALPV
ncbi:hypothetical protein V2J09_015084 [Rumex salicifolius]